MRPHELLMQVCAGMAKELKRAGVSAHEAFATAMRYFNMHCMYVGIVPRDSMWGVGRDVISSAAGVDLTGVL